ncbi:MAG: membrane protein insertion efficiency factor YidD [Verrucomicrobiaceae bacterium]|nr:membrane protein insertion efficiency factor YidD [Verrucomicrobiaceae bacterium]
MKTILILCVRFYQVVISPPLHFLAGPLGGCRYFPSCSQYFIDAVTVNGPIKGPWFGLLRILRCNPFGGQGYDPPPGWEEYVAKHPEAAYVGRRKCDIDPSKISTPNESIEDPLS